MAWFAKLSPAGTSVVGQRITAGVNEIERDGVIIGTGHAPQWLYPDTVIWAEDGGTGLWTHTPNTPPVRTEIRRETNGLQANGRGDYIAEHRAVPFGYTHNGRFVASDITPELWPDGSLTWESLIWQGTIVQTPEGPWVVEQQPWRSPDGDTRLIAHPEGELNGYVVVVGDSHGPDAAWVTALGALRVVWTRHGLTGDRVLSLAARRVDLRLTVPEPKPPPMKPPPGPIPTPVPKPPMPIPPYPDEFALAEAFALDYREAGLPDADVLSGVWQGRTIYDHCAGMALAPAILKHRGELRAALNLPPLNAVKPPPESEPDTLPADPTRWLGNFLAFPGYPFAHMYPGWPEPNRRAFRAAYRQAGYTHLPVGIFGSYGGVTFDFRDNPEGYIGIVQELRSVGIEPCVFVHTDAVPRRAPFSRDALTTWARSYLPHLRPFVRLWCAGWEFNQIDQHTPVYWCGDGTEHLAWARDLRGILGTQATLYCHFSPERITGWPNYPNHDGPQDEPGWWHAEHFPFTGILYQRPPDEEDRFTLAHTIGGTDEKGGTDVGDVNRIAGGLWGVHKDFVAFEMARDPTRHARLGAQFLNHPLVKGIC